MAISRPTSVVSVRQTLRALRARSTPTTAMIGSSVYMCAKYRRCCATSGRGSSVVLMRACASFQARYSGRRSAAR
eukprot:5765286-Pleurochrysis_carterae.AAC.1